MNNIKVLDKGYINLINTYGSDLDVVNAARVSYDKESLSLDEKDEKLISFLVKHKHDSVLRHCAMTFEVYAPLMVARQWYKHAVASSHMEEQLGWNESSRRYVTEVPEFYIPLGNEWRSAPENSKQGSGEPVDVSLGGYFSNKLFDMAEQGLDLYNKAMKMGIAAEQARLFLPAYSLYVRWRWTASLNALLHFLTLRDKSDAQSEIQAYANVLSDMIEEKFPVTTKAWREYRVQ